VSRHHAGARVRDLVERGRVLALENELLPVELLPGSPSTCAD
jgi:hypothetical protein